MMQPCKTLFINKFIYKFLNLKDVQKNKKKDTYQLATIGINVGTIKYYYFDEIHIIKSK